MPKREQNKIYIMIKARPPWQMMQAGHSIGPGLPRSSPTNPSMARRPFLISLSFSSSSVPAHCREKYVENVSHDRTRSPACRHIALVFCNLLSVFQLPGVQHADTSQLTSQTHKGSCIAQASQNCTVDWGGHLLPGMKGAKMPPGYPGSCLGRLHNRIQPLTQNAYIQHTRDLVMQKRICSRPHKYMAILCNSTLNERRTFLRLRVRLLQSL